MCALILPFSVSAVSPARMAPPPDQMIPLGTQPVRDIVKPVKVDFSGLSVSQVVAVVYGEIMLQPYVIDSAVLKDERAVSLRFDGAKGDIKRFWLDFLDAMGMEVTVRGGVDYVAMKRVVEHKDAEPQLEPFIYRTKYRSTAYLVEMLSPLFQPGGFALNRSVRALVGDRINIGSTSASSIPSHSAASLIDQESDTLIFNGTSKEIAVLEKLLPKLDIAAGEVIIKAVVYEVTTGQSDATAFSLAANVLGGKFGVSLGSIEQLANALTFRSANFEAAFSALAADSRFKAVSSPRVRVKSGQQARLVVGADVPTLGAVTVPQGGAQPIQSVDYRSSGVILSLSPTVRESSVEVVVDQQISDFARTETGVNNSPTLTKRSLSTTVTASDGELIVLGGLMQNKNSTSTSGLSFLPKFMRTASESDSRTEILLLLQVSKLVL
ncbi:type II secretory pathway protein [Janthinobacterium sp. SUN026]|uniref:type II secretion system protein GspD n=1 Tax=Janthinobacterium sp. SUN026 TaxID=3002438 RepID=UPI0025AF795D|nr:type II secretory pathway protein [Janthinobacterium sp. SUN026]MDN2672860.1 type II secretory pathway protein [Janthinobacterium sp. SUN026]